MRSRSGLFHQPRSSTYSHVPDSFGVGGMSNKEGERLPASACFISVMPVNPRKYPLFQIILTVLDSNPRVYFLLIVELTSLMWAEQRGSKLAHPKSYANFISMHSRARPSAPVLYRVRVQQRRQPPQHTIPHPPTFFSPHPALGCHRSPHPSLAVRLFLTKIITNCSRQKDLPGLHKEWKTGRPGARLSRTAICPWCRL